MRGSQYSAQFKAKALTVIAACDGNLTEASRMTGVPCTTLSDWVHERRGIDDEVRRMRDEKKRDLADMSEELARTVWGDLMEAAKRGKASYGHLNAAFGTAIDKAQLLRGKATVIVDNLAAKRGLALSILNAKLERGVAESEALEQMRMAEIDPDDIAWVAGLSPEQRTQQAQELGRIG